MARTAPVDDREATSTPDRLTAEGPVGAEGLFSPATESRWAAGLSPGLEGGVDFLDAVAPGVHVPVERGEFGRVDDRERGRQLRRAGCLRTESPASRHQVAAAHAYAEEMVIRADGGTPRWRRIRPDQVGLAGTVARLLTAEPTDDAGWPADLPPETAEVVIVDDTPGPLLTVRVHPVGDSSAVSFVRFDQLAVRC
ncbi:hypothetical protein ACFUN8_36975 [Streptomyces sp. NPDC057307]|uniref:DUF7161 family protein n=1 Tax=Streptomyces sp. NPDC057307 TaxID=3346096 RepID=UPI0036298FA3